MSFPKIKPILGALSNGQILEDLRTACIVTLAGRPDR